MPWINFSSVSGSGTYPQSMQYIPPPRAGSSVPVLHFGQSTAHRNPAPVSGTGCDAPPLGPLFFSRDDTANLSDFVLFDRLRPGAKHFDLARRHWPTGRQLRPALGARPIFQNPTPHGVNVPPVVHPRAVPAFGAYRRHVRRDVPPRPAWIARRHLRLPRRHFLTTADGR